MKMGKSKAHQHRDIKEGGEFVNIRPPPPTCYIVVGTAQLSSAGCWMDCGLASASAGLKQWQFRWQDTLSTLTFNVGRSFVRSFGLSLYCPHHLTLGMAASGAGHGHGFRYIFLLILSFLVTAAVPIQREI